MGAIFWTSPVQAGGSWSYGVTTTDTPTMIDTSKTSAVIDTTNNEIILPRSAPKTASFTDESMDYVVLSPTKIIHYSFNGSTVQENTILSVSVTNPVAGIASAPYPDVIVANGTTVTHYSFTGSSMVSNPVLTVSGMIGIVSIGSRDMDIGVLDQGQVKYYASTGSSMAQVSALSITSGLTNPIDFALSQDSYDAVVLEPDRARYFAFTGSGLTEVPALAITGLSGAKAVATADGEIAIIAGNQVKHYSFAGSSFSYNAALSVTSGLNSPTCVALKKGSYDRLIVDGDQVKYYQWDGTQLVYNPSLSATVAGLSSIGSYAPSAVVQSLAKSTGNPCDNVRVRAYHVLPNNTSVTWSVSADGGTTWTKKWRVRGLAGSTVCEITNDNGATWTPLGDMTKASPSSDTPELWLQLAAGTSVVWKAELATADTSVTPKIIAQGGVAVVWEASSKPTGSFSGLPGSCFVTTTPTINWTFSDADGDTQSAYQIQVRKLDGTTVVFDSGKIAGSTLSYTIPTSNQPDLSGPLWSAGTYEFKIYGRVWDSKGVASDWFGGNYFCVVGFERPRIAEIVSPPAGQTAPDPNTASTHIVITPGMSVLPKVKAGAKVRLLIDSIGPLMSANATFPYLSTQATTDNFSAGYPLGNAVNRWSVEFWTDDNVANCPTGTIVKMNWSGVSPKGNPTLNAPPYASGVVQIEGSVLDDWIVILKEKN
ncbi:MAG: hypothetical protein HPY90_05490 [Syntrophothermus sp.]|uniref:glycoside hydrolase family 78 protein n=1 Tax=Syntrophothermus sp. TaxID=2736299 RepID=UPI00257D40F1|nr:hypothetical protein [Syntrophothermus sp.]NSW82717.1 hypothetical protein [Syntrophothermus sp.]